MRAITRNLVTALLVLTAALLAAAQDVPLNPPAPAPAAAAVAGPAQTEPATPALPTTASSATPALPASIQPLMTFQNSEIKFSLPDLMDLLRDRRHEGWVLAAYPDPKTGRPLIGAGFSLDLPERQHPQSDALNPHTFVEPSSAELWQAAGLAPGRLQLILAEFNDHLAAWRTTKRYRKNIALLPPEITEDDASQLLRISAIQAIENARAYCRNFDQLTGPQQMALSQLVYQMGVNLEEFGRFLGLMNGDSAAALAPGATLVAASADNTAGAAVETAAVNDTGHWKAVQQSLMESQWARVYRVRAVSVIAMLDPRYPEDPAASEQRIAAVLHPVVHRRRGRSGAALRAAAYHQRSGHALAKKTSRARAKRKV